MNATPAIVDRNSFQAEVDQLRLREKAHTQESDAIAAARRKLPMVEVDGTTQLSGERGTVTLLDAFEGRSMLLAGRKPGMMYLISYLRQGAKVFETYWTTRRGVEVMDNTYHLLDLTVYGRQEQWEQSPRGWPQLREGKMNMRDGERPISQWSRLESGRPDELSPR